MNRVLALFALIVAIRLAADFPDSYAASAASGGFCGVFVALIFKEKL